MLPAIPAGVATAAMMSAGAGTAVLSVRASVL